MAGDPLRSSPRLTALLLAVMLAVVVVWQAPHTVHHLFDSDEVQPAHECVFAAIAERGVSTAAESVTLHAVHDVTLPLVVSSRSLLPVAPSRTAAARAPPAFLS
ncbi:MAG TPA: hypothetical protein VGL09_14455 [Methylomirabilota bacterium]